MYFVEGTIGNVAAIALLTRPQIRSCFFNQLLAVLATFDILYIITMMIESLKTLRPDIVETYFYTKTFPILLYPLNHISMTGSIFTTVGVTLERFIATYKPIYYNQVIKNVTGHTKRFIQYTLTITILSVLFNIPKFLESEVVEDNSGFLYIDYTELRTNPLYNSIYHCWSRLFVLGILPFSVVSILNVMIYLAIKKLRRRHQKEEERLCIILITIVVLFFVCNLPRLILNIHETYNLDQITLCSFTPLGKERFHEELMRSLCLGGRPIWIILLGNISHVLLVLNSSANFYIYCVIGANLRHQLKMAICCK